MNDESDRLLQALLAQYRVQSNEKLFFTAHFIFALLLIAVGWITNHVFGHYQLGLVIAIMATIYALGMATHTGNAIQVLKQIATKYNEFLPVEWRTFPYELGGATDKTRFVVTLIGKIIAGLVFLSCFTTWPQF